MWAMTLITYKGSFGHHAKICIEGLTNGEYFSRVADFTGSLVRIPKVNKIKRTTRSEIWMTSEKVQAMIVEIGRESVMINQGEIDSPYSKLGESSLIILDDEWRGETELP